MGWRPDIDGLVARASELSSIDDWKGAAQDLLSDQPCVFHRNREISALYASLYLRWPSLFKWAGMAATASHHMRLALWPLRIGASPSGYVDLPSLIGGHQRLRLQDVDLLRDTNNAIFDDIFWVHLAYAGDRYCIPRLRRAVGDDSHYMPVLDAFATLEEGRQLVEQGRGEEGEELIWSASLALLHHEQCALVQPRFSKLSQGFARAFSFGATLGFEVRGLRRYFSFFTSFYGWMFRRHLGEFLRARRLPSVAAFRDRWRWVAGAIVPRFRRYEGTRDDIEAALNAIVKDATG